MNIGTDDTVYVETEQQGRLINRRPCCSVNQHIFQFGRSSDDLCTSGGSEKILVAESPSYYNEIKSCVPCSLNIHFAVADVDGSLTPAPEFQESFVDGIGRRLFANAVTAADRKVKQSRKMKLAQCPHGVVVLV